MQRAGASEGEWDEVPSLRGGAEVAGARGSRPWGSGWPLRSAAPSVAQGLPGRPLAAAPALGLPVCVQSTRALLGEPECSPTSRSPRAQGEPVAKKARSNPQVYMDIKIGNKPAGRIQMLLHADVVAMTAGERDTGRDAGG